MSDGFFSSVGVETKVVDNSIVTVEDTLTLSTLPILVGGFSSKGVYNKTVKLNNPNKVTQVFGTDFDDMTKYGQQNLNFLQQLRGGGTGFFVRLLHDDSAKKANRLVSVKLKKNDTVALYERDGYGSFKLDEGGEKIPLMYEKDNGLDDGGTTPTAVTVPGVECSVLLSSVEDGEIPSSAISTENDGKIITVPLFFIYSNTKGVCGNNFGIVVNNDFQRDEMVDDGRRYIMKTYEMTSLGYSQQSKEYFFSFNPEAVQSEVNSTSEALDSVYTNLDEYNNSTDVQLYYYAENFSEIERFVESAITDYNTYVAGKETEDKPLYDVLVTRTDYVPATSIDVDYINLKTKEQVFYDYFVEGSDHNYLSNTVTSMEGGDDGWLSDIGTVVLNPFANPDAERGQTAENAIQLATSDVTDLTNSKTWKYGIVTKEFREIVKKQLLIDFYNCDIPELRKEVLSILKCPAGYIADAGYDMDVKKSLIEFASLRKDMAVVFDGTMSCTNLDVAIQTYRQLANLISMDNDPQRFAFVPHIGTTTNTTKKNRVTGTYEYCYDLAKVYSTKPFAIVAGYQNQFGAVRTMVFDWVVEEDKPRGSQFKKAKENCITYAVDMGEAASATPEDNTTKKKYYWMANRSFYPKKNSKFIEFRNGIITADLRRVASIVLARYTYDTETAETNMAKAKKDLDKQISGRYSKDLSITTSFFQTDHNKITNTCSVTITVKFPDIIETYSVTISGERMN